MRPATWKWLQQALKSTGRAPSRLSKRGGYAVFPAISRPDAESKMLVWSKTLAPVLAPALGEQRWTLTTAIVLASYPPYRSCCRVQQQQQQQHT